MLQVSELVNWRYTGSAAGVELEIHRCDLGFETIRHGSEAECCCAPEAVDTETVLAEEQRAVGLADVRVV